jgi:hypothetical protein
VREVAFSTPKRDCRSDRERNHNYDALSLLFKLPALRKRQLRNTTKQSGRYCRLLLQLDLLANDSNTIAVASSQPDP